MEMILKPLLAAAWLHKYFKFNTPLNPPFYFSFYPFVTHANDCFKTMA